MTEMVCDFDDRMCRDPAHHADKKRFELLRFELCDRGVRGFVRRIVDHDPAVDKVTVQTGQLRYDFVMLELQTLVGRIDLAEAYKTDCLFFHFFSSRAGPLFLYDHAATDLRINKPYADKRRQ